VLAILRTTLLGLFSLVTLWANRIKGEHGVLPNRVRWYPKADPTFSDALALVRLELWTSPTFATSPDHRESAKNTDRLLNRLIRVACNPPVNSSLEGNTGAFFSMIGVGDLVQQGVEDLVGSSVSMALARS